jgi:hypothetical protein
MELIFPMKRRRILLLLALAAVAIAAGLVLFSPRGPKEPVWCDVPITQWLSEVQFDPGSERGMLGRKAVLAIGTNAIPYYLAQFSQRDSTWTERFNHWLSKQDVVGFRFPSKGGQLFSAAQGLRMLGTNATPTLPILAGYIGDSELSQYATMAMSGCGEAALPYLSEGIASTNRGTIFGAVSGLGQLAEHTESALQPLIQMLEHTNWEVRMLAAGILREKVPHPDVVVLALIRALSDSDFRVQRVAASSLGQFGELAKPAVPSLLGLLSNTNDWVAVFASNAVLRIDPAAVPPRRQ